MRAAHTVWASYRLLFANLGAFLQIAAGWALVVTLTSELELFLRDTKLPDSERPFLLVLAPSLLTLIVSTAGSICFAVVWHRFVVLGEPARRFFPAVNDVLGPYLARTCVAMLVPMSLYVIVTWAPWRNKDDLLIDIFLFVGMSVLLAAGARLWLALPASAVGDAATTFRQSWAATRGHGAEVFAGLLVCDLPFTAMAIAVDRLTKDFDVDSVEGIAAYAALQMIDLARNVVWTVFVSYAYLEFVRAKQTPADQFR